MTRTVVPYRGAGAKARMSSLQESVRRDIALAMLADVLAACCAAGDAVLVTDNERAERLARDLGASVFGDPGGGQGPAVAAAVDALGPGGVLVVNGDVPCVVPHDLRALERAAPPDGLAYVPAADGTTNALALASPELFAPLYGPGSAERFRARAQELGVDAVAATIPNLADDVDSLADLGRVALRAGPRTQAAIAALGLAA